MNEKLLRSKTSNVFIVDEKIDLRRLSSFLRLLARLPDHRTSNNGPQRMAVRTDWVHIACTSLMWDSCLGHSSFLREKKKRTNENQKTRMDNKQTKTWTSMNHHKWAKQRQRRIVVFRSAKRGNRKSLFYYYFYGYNRN